MSVKLLEKSFMSAEFARQTFFASPTPGTSIDTVVQPEYWAHVARKMNPHDIIEVVPENGEYYARLIVLSVGKLWVKVQKLQYELLVSQKKESIGAAENFEPKWGGPVAKWRVIRKSDGEAISTDSFQTQEDAEKWIEGNARGMVAA